tara:strand:- start:592 stop:873 length:282 start_codon:yes stop_codon:yes gene_type:complete
MIIEREQLTVSRKEWECYRSTPDFVIDEINSTFLEILQTTNSPRYAQKRFYDFAYDSGFDLYGLRDTECCIVATDIINTYYKSNIDRWAYMEI